MTAKKATLKSLQLEISIIKEELKDIKIELKEAKEELKEVQSVKEEKQNKKLEKNSETFDSNSKKDYDCRKCELICTTKYKLRAHIKTSHPKAIKCTYCEEVFSQHFELEKHLEKHKKKEFTCEVCKKDFHLEWRLNKHIASHEFDTWKYCHYFNNKKSCPYEDIGCMFKHEKSENCRFNKICRNKLCPYQHQDISVNKQNDKNGIQSVECEVNDEIVLTNDIEEDASDADSYEFECDHCEETFELESEVKMHLENRHCNNCGEYFVATNTLNIHKKKCT